MTDDHIPAAEYPPDMPPPDKAEESPAQMLKNILPKYFILNKLKPEIHHGSCAYLT